jgi:2-oxoglutarate dehydrogenase E2 component (dihydrolipoamide succinyltransferase)
VPTKGTDGGGGGDGRGDGASRSATGRVLSPVVRRLIKEHDLDPATISATGAGGRITRADVLDHIDRMRGPKAEDGAPPAPGPARAGPPRPSSSERAPAPERAPAQAEVAAPTPAAKSGPALPGADQEIIPFSNIRRRTAEHMTRSKATSAHALTAIEVDFEAVDRVRRAERENFKRQEGFSLTYLPFVCRTVIDAMAEFPHLNASVVGDDLVVHRRVHLGIAVDLSFEGLIVPVVHHADSKRLRAIAREIADLAARARSRKLSADEISGGTFTVTNPGPFGTLITAPIINQPQVAILSTDGVKKRPVAVELPDGGDGIAVHPVGVLALSFDHRAVDGAYASAFLNRCRQIIETREWSQEL